MKKKPQKQSVPMNQMATSVSAPAVPGRGPPLCDKPCDTRPAAAPPTAIYQHQVPSGDILDFLK
ncbi:unnamed protein product [Gongylonema pulchrum]|uniref:Small muscular protein n=1 Tax=Gongylonema pulchrum TaxID=637853 RepID=A0A183EIS3_9BILA|nr:unnamed protein product [Gongylonema pulchrum]